MTTTLKTTTKPARKTAAKKTTAAKPFSLIAYVAEQVAARLSKPYYKTALAYHKRAATKFPRERIDEVRKALTKEDADKVFDKHDKGILPSGDKVGQACFDIYMLSLK